MDLNKRRYVNYVKALAVAFGLILFDKTDRRRKFKGEESLCDH